MLRAPKSLSPRAASPTDVRSPELAPPPRRRSTQPSYPNMVNVLPLAAPELGSGQPAANDLFVVEDLLDGSALNLAQNGSNPLASFAYGAVQQVTGLTHPFGPPTASLGCDSTTVRPKLIDQNGTLALHYLAENSTASELANCTWTPSALWFNQGALAEPLLTAATSDALRGNATADLVACDGVVVSAPLYLVALPFGDLPAAGPSYARAEYKEHFAFIPVPVTASSVTCLSGNKSTVASYNLLFDPHMPPVLGYGSKTLLPFGAPSPSPSASASASASPKIVICQQPSSIPMPSYFGTNLQTALAPLASTGANTALDAVQAAGLLFGTALLLAHLLPRSLQRVLRARKASTEGSAEVNEAAAH